MINWNVRSKISPYNRLQLSGRRFTDMFNMGQFNLKIAILTIAILSSFATFMIYKMLHAAPVNPADASFVANAASITNCAGQSECFAFTIDTRLTATGATTGTSRDFIIPTSSTPDELDPKGSYPYDWIINWGDGQTQTIAGVSDYDSAGISHTYSTAGIKQITIRPNGTAANGWFLAFGFGGSEVGGNIQANRDKFRSINTPITTMMRKIGVYFRFKAMFMGARNGLGIPTNLLSSVDYTGAINWYRTYQSMFKDFAYNSTNAILPEGLFSNINATTITNANHAFRMTFEGYGYNSTIGDIPANLFGQFVVDTTDHTDNRATAIFLGTFRDCFHESTVGTIPAGLFSNVSIKSTGTNSSVQTFYGTFHGYANKSTIGNIPSGLFSILNTTGAQNNYNIFQDTFREYAQFSTVGNIPANLFSTINTGSGIDMRSMFSRTFYRYAQASTVGTIPFNIFPSINTIHSTNVSSMFYATFDTYAQESTVGNIPAGIFTNIRTANATNMDLLFHYTFTRFASKSVNATVSSNIFANITIPDAIASVRAFGWTFQDYGMRRAEFIDNGVTISDQVFTNIYSVKKTGQAAPESDNDFYYPGDKPIATYSRDITIENPLPGVLPAPNWSAKDGKSCSAPGAGPDCGAQTSTVYVSFTVPRWRTNTSTSAAPTLNSFSGNMKVHRLVISDISLSKNIFYDSAPKPYTSTITSAHSAASLPPYQYQLYGASAGNSEFTIGGTQLTFTGAYPTENTKMYPIAIRVTDSNGNIFNKYFSIMIRKREISLSIIENPTNISSSSTVDVTPLPFNVNPNRMSSIFHLLMLSDNNLEGNAKAYLSTSSTNRNLINQTTGSVVSPTSGTQTTPSVLNTNQWGYRTTSAWDSATSWFLPQTKETNVVSSAFTWSGVPNSSNPALVMSYTGALDSSYRYVYFGMRTSSTTHSGSYQQSVTYTVIADD